MGLITCSNFENPDGWRPNNLAQEVIMEVLADGTARVGNNYLQVRTAVPGGSVAIDFSADTLAKVDPPFGSWYVLAWVRAPTQPVEGELTLWEIEEDRQNLVRIGRKFEVFDDKWIMIESALDLDQNAPGETPIIFRVEFYLSSADVPLDIDTVMVWA